MTDRIPPRDTLPVRTPGLSLVQPPPRTGQLVMPPPPTCHCTSGSAIPADDRQ